MGDTIGILSFSALSYCLPSLLTMNQAPRRPLSRGFSLYKEWKNVSQSTQTKKGES